MTTNTTADIDDGLEDEERDDGRMYRDGLLNGDEKFNRFVKLTDSRFLSAARRANKHRKAARDEFATLRTELGPVIEFAAFIITIKRYAAPVGGLIAAIGTGLLFLNTIGVDVWSLF